jgi:O-antigen ligase
MLCRFAQIAFFVLVFSLGFMQPSIWLFNFRVHLTDFIFLFAFTIWLLSIVFKKSEFRFSSFYILLIFYFLALLVSTIFSVNPKQSFIKLLGEIYLFGLCILTFNTVRSPEILKKVFYAWLAATFVVSLLGFTTVILFYVSPESIFLKYTLHHYGTLIPGNYPRIQATFHYPSMLCNYLSISLLILFISYKNDWIKQKTFLFLLVLTLTTLFFTLTPGLGGIALSFGIWLWLIFREKSKPRLACFCLAGGIFLAVAMFFVSLISPVQTPTSPYFVDVPFTEKRLDPSVRVLTWQSALETFSNNFINGTGIGTSAASVIYQDASGRTQLLKDAHQIWLNVAAEAGIFGLASILAITVYFWRKCFPLRLGKNEKENLQAGLAVAVISAFFYQGFVGSFEDARQLWILFGLVMAAEKLPDSL